MKHSLDEHLAGLTVTTVATTLWENIARIIIVLCEDGEIFGEKDFFKALDNV